MKKAFLLLTVITTVSLGAIAQTHYYSGFDNATENAGWTEFRKGYTASSHWTASSVPGAPTGPNVLYHDYNVGGSGTDTIKDWYVSPVFNFANGGKVDSLKINLSGFSSQPAPEDSLVLYLLVGNKDPNLATQRIRLANLTQMYASFSTVFKDTGNFVIPSVSGNSYIAFRYHSSTSWFVPAIDNLHITQNALTSISNIEKPAGITVYPNPARESIHISIPGNYTGSADISLTDIIGRTLLHHNTGFISGNTDLDISPVPAGNYLLQIKTAEGMHAHQVTLTD